MTANAIVTERASAVSSDFSDVNPHAKKPIWRQVYEALRDANSTRNYETRVALKYFADCKSILDVGCGTGNFIQCDPKRIVGIDYSPDCVRICKSKGFNVQEGDALDLPFEDNTFDGVYSAHVMHVFFPQDAVKYLSELVRVVKPNGVISVCTIPDNRRSWIHAENARPYPPIALRNLFKTASEDTETAPTFRGLPQDVKQEAIWFRRPALFEVLGHSSHRAAAIGSMLNGLQYRALLRKYWDFNGYVIKLRNSSKAN